MEQNTDNEEKYTNNEKRKLTFWAGVLTGFAASLVIVAAVGLATVFDINIGGALSGDASKNATASVADINYAKINSKLKKIGELLESEYLYADDTDAEAIETGLFKGTLYSIGDLYADYYSPDEFEDELTESNGNYCGIGVLMSYDAANNTITVNEVYKNSPAEEAGITAGDRLAEVNHEDISILDFETVVDEYIKGEEGTYVTLTFERDGEEAPLDFQVERRQVEVTTVKTAEIDTGGGKKAGYINISSFEKATVNQFREAMDKFDTEEYEGIVIDLRDNPGGVMESAVMMADYIISDNISTYSDHDYDGEYRGRTLLLYTENKRGKDSAYYSSDKHSSDADIVILVNGNSASSSEIFTGALKDYKKATIVGTKTYGKGIVQSIFNLQDGSAVKFTTDSYYTPAGTEIHGVGIIPDIEAEPDETLLENGADPENPDPETDNQLKTALESFKD